MDGTSFFRSGLNLMRSRAAVGVIAVAAGLVAGCDRAPSPHAPLAQLMPGLGYTNERIAAGPWSIHVVEVDRTRSATRAPLELHSVHAGGRALGLSPLSEQLHALPKSAGTPVAAVNGDFYQRDRPHAGDPRGLQIVEGELISAPTGGVAFWTDADHHPHTGSVHSRLEVIWEDGTRTPVGLNEERGPDAAVLFTPAAGPTTHTPDGLEIVLEPQGNSAGRPLAAGTTNRVRVRESQSRGDTRIDAGTWVLSLGRALVRTRPAPAAGTLLTLSVATEPDLHGARTAIGGGPVLVRNGKAERIQAPSKDSYEFSSMSERHPRTAIGWNDRAFYLVEVDGRQPDLSVGMTLAELGATLLRLGCTDAMNLDGGGSATLWADGRVRNSPCDGQERPIANALVVVRPD